MANIAQTVNVLQAVILTEGEKMLLTPTYHAFDMFKVHQDAELLSLNFESPDYTYNGDKIPQLSVSSSQDKDGKVHVSICNLSPVQDIDIDIDVRGITAHCVSGKILTSKTMNAKNTFEDSNNVKIDVFGDAQLENNHVKCTIPSKSVVVLGISIMKDKCFKCEGNVNISDEEIEKEIKRVIDSGVPLTKQINMKKD